MRKAKVDELNFGILGAGCEYDVLGLTSAPDRVVDDFGARRPRMRSLALRTESKSRRADRRCDLTVLSRAPVRARERNRVLLAHALQ